MCMVNALLPYAAGSLISRVREYGKVDKVEYRDDGIQLEADVDAHLAAQVVEQSIDYSDKHHSIFCDASQPG